MRTQPPPGDNPAVSTILVVDDEPKCATSSCARRVFSRDQLMDDRVWEYQSALATGTVTVHIRRLRKKIEDDASRPRHLETVFGARVRRRSTVPRY
jgi:hypothetical protein